MSMTPQERDLIDRLFTRLAAEPAGAKDQEAVLFINERVRTLPDPGYALVHALAVQDVTLQQATARIAELERQLAVASAPQAASGSSFLGGVTAPAPRPMGAFQGVSPQTVAPQPVYQGQPAPQQQVYQGQPVYQAQPAYQPQQSFAGVPPQPGGFLHSVLGTAAGVAGGMLAAEAVSDLFTGHRAFGLGGGGLLGGGGFSGGGVGPWGGGSETVVNETVNETVVNNNYYDDGNSGGQPDYSGQDYSSNDPGSDFASDSSDMGTDIGYDGGGGGSDWG